MINVRMTRENLVSVLAHLRYLQDTYDNFAKAGIPKSAVFEARYVEVEQLKLKIAKQIAAADAKAK